MGADLSSGTRGLWGRQRKMNDHMVTLHEETELYVLTW